MALYRWVVDGTPPRPIGDVATVAASWSAAGWSVESRSDGSAVTTTPDGYTLDASTSSQGNLSIVAGSPCVAKENTGGPAAPAVIPHPAS